MDRKIITKDPSGEITQKSEPIMVKPSYDVSSERNESYQEYYDHSMRMSHHHSDGSSLNGLEINLISSKLSHSFTTNFQSPDFQSMNWSSNPLISGTGGEIVFISGTGKSKDVSFIFGGGGFKNKRETNAHNENSIYVIEKTKTTSLWVHIGIRAKPLPLIYLQGLLGAFSFDVNTDEETNASTYKYEGLSGNRTFSAIGIGGGFESPGDYPVHLFIGTRAWLPISNDTFYENSIGQLNSGILFNF